MIYLDNAATTRVCGAAQDAARDAMLCFGNPSSPHGMGREAAKALDESRREVADALGLDADGLVFTSGGTEANNLAVFSAAKQGRRTAKRIVTNYTEHPSVLAPAAALAAEGFEVVYVPVTGGVVDLGALAEAAKDACLAAFMYANNQTGCVLNLREIRRVLDDIGSPALLHCDAVQAFCKTKKDDFASVCGCCDTVAVSAHKIGGIKGCGALWHSKRAKISPLICGGEQENGLRGGTHNTVGIAAFGAACRDHADHPEYLDRVSSLSRLLREGVTAELGDRVKLFTPPSHLDCIVNLAVSGLRSEVCLNYLSSRGICISSSSACSTRAKKNTVLPAYGLDREYIDCAVRVGISHLNTEEEIETFVAELKNAAAFARPGRA